MVVEGVMVVVVKVWNVVFIGGQPNVPRGNIDVLVYISTADLPHGAQSSYFLNFTLKTTSTSYRERCLRLVFQSINHRT